MSARSRSPLDAARAIVGSIAYLVIAACSVSAWEGGGVFLAWSVLLVVAAWALFHRRDLGDS